jgi:hypothetical protein
MLRHELSITLDGEMCLMPHESGSWIPYTEMLLAVTVLRDIAAMGKSPGSETAKNWLYNHGYALREGGYIPGKGFEEVVRPERIYEEGKL